MTSPKFVYAFEEGDGKNKMLLGGKGANLCEMTQIGLNVPPGFTLTTDACRAYLEHDALPQGLMDEVLKYMKDLEKKTGKTFGGGDNPLLVSVRSGSSMSMPGMMDTILNLGINKTSLLALIKLTDNPRFAYDAYRRFIQLFGKIALGVDDKHFDDAMAVMKKKVGVKEDVALDAEHLAELADQFAKIIEVNTGKTFPRRALQTTGNRNRCRVPFLERQARHRLSPAVQDHQRAGQRNGGQYLHYGFRQYG